MNFWDAIVLFGVIQGFATGAIIIGLNQGRKSSNYLIASLLFVLGLTCLNLLVDNLGLHFRYEWVWNINRFFPLLHAILIGPLIYLVARSEVDPEFSFHKLWLHFLPGLWSFIPHFLEIYKALFSTSDDYGKFIEGFFRFGDIVLWLTATIYLLLSRKLLADAEEAGKKTQLLRNFVRIFLLFQFAIWLPFLLVYVSPWDYIIWENGIDYYFIYIPMVIMIYWVGIQWLMDRSDPRGNKEKRESLLGEEELAHQVTKIKDAMLEEKLFLDPDLSLKSMAQGLGIPINQLSYVLNEGLSKNFNEFVNDYRVKEVCKKLKDPSFDHLTIAAVALGSGFKSIPTFQRTFKQIAGKTPKEYKKDQLEQSL